VGVEVIEKKRANGQYFTISNNPFKLQAFTTWARDIGRPERTILEPFAGANNIVRSLQELNLCNDFLSYDIEPADREVQAKDTLRSFPSGFDVCITNPPWLAKNSATRRNLPYPDCQYDDIYKYCLELCLMNCEYVAALIPASFMQSTLFRERLRPYVLLHDIVFNDTENPVCLALFNGCQCANTEIYYDDQFIGNLDELQARIPIPKTNKNIRFNDPNGDLGFISFDNTRGRSIRFCDSTEIDQYEIKVSSRFITRISGDLGDLTDLIPKLNDRLNQFRDETCDLFLTPFKGIRDDGQYRRRMFFSQARCFINAS